MSMGCGHHLFFSTSSGWCGLLGKWWLGLVLAFVLAGDFEGPSNRDYS